MASKQTLNLASDHFIDLVNLTKDQLRHIQRTPIGTEPRSPQEQASIWRKLRQLPPHYFNAILDEAARQAGHKNDEGQPCSVCAFVYHHASREGKRMAKAEGEGD